MEALADARFNVVFPCVFDGAHTLWHSPTAKTAFGADCDPVYGERDLVSEILFEAHRVGLEVVPWFERFLYAPVIAWVNRWAVRARAIQSGSAHAYLTYLVIALLGLLAILLVRGT